MDVLIDDETHAGDQTNVVRERNFLSLWAGAWQAKAQTCRGLLIDSEDDNCQPDQALVSPRWSVFSWGAAAPGVTL